MDGEAWCRLLSMGSQRVGQDWATSLHSLIYIYVYVFLLLNLPKLSLRHHEISPLNAKRLYFVRVIVTYNIATTQPHLCVYSNYLIMLKTNYTKYLFHFLSLTFLHGYILIQSTLYIFIPYSMGIYFFNFRKKYFISLTQPEIRSTDRYQRVYHWKSVRCWLYILVLFVIWLYFHLPKYKFYFQGGAD